MTGQLLDPAFRRRLAAHHLLDPEPWHGDETGVYDDTDAKRQIAIVWDWDESGDNAAACSALLAEARNFVATARPEVLAFARLMEEKLRKHDPAHPEGWKDGDPGDLLDGLQEHIEKMVNRYWIGSQPDIIASDIADCLNYLMMIADVCGLLPQREGGA